MKLDLGVICDFAYIGDGAKFYILGEFRIIYAKDFPATHARMSLALRIVGRKTEGLEHKLKLVLVDEDGNSILPTLEAKIKFGDPGPGAGGRIQAQVALELGGVKFLHEGDYRFDVFVDDRIAGDVQLQLVKMDPPSSA
jgi:hypothetical protein